MLMVLLFNLLGYQFFYSYIIDQASFQIREKADHSQLVESDLTEIKIKLNLPYIKDWASYERYDGELELNGVYYSYVKRKVYHDTLFLLCVRNERKTALTAEKIAFHSTTNDLQRDGKGSKEFSLKKGPFSPEYRQIPDEYLFALYLVVGCGKVSAADCQLSDPYLLSFDQPPEA